MLRLLVRAVIAAVIVTLPAQAEVWIVDAGGEGDFTDIQTAVNAAADGDSIWVRVGQYPPVTIRAKSLHIAGAYTWPCVWCDRITVSDLGADQRLVLANLYIKHDYMPIPTELEIRNCDGAVRVQKCYVGSRRYSPGAWNASVEIKNCHDVVFVGGAITGEDGTPAARTAGLLVENSTVSIWDCHLSGADAGEGADGSNTCRIIDTFLFLASTEIRGGYGGDAHCDDPGDGGAAVVIRGDSEVVLLDSEIIGGPGGYDEGWWCGGNGKAGPAFDIDGPGTVQAWSGAARNWEWNPVAIHGSTFTIEVTGQPGDRIYAARAPIPVSIPRPELHGMQFVEGVPSVLPFLGIVDENGELTIELPISKVIPDVPPIGSSGSSDWRQSILLQMFVVDTDGECWAGPPGQLLVPDLPEPACLEPIFVRSDAPPGGNGRSWERAFANLQEAFDLVATEDGGCYGVPREVWVAGGVYIPPAIGTAPPEPYQVTNSVGVFGGFAGDELFLDERDPELNLTLIDGDVLGDDGPGFVNYDDNARGLIECVAVDGQVHLRLDGLILRGGNAQGWGGAVKGPLHISEGSLRLSRCRFVENRAAIAGAAFGSFSFVDHCVFERNHAKEIGALGCRAGSRVIACRFLDNDSETYAGAALVAGHNPPYQYVTIDNCLFARNSAMKGGALRCDAPTITNCTFVDNHASRAGGGIYVQTNWKVVVQNSILWGNTAAGVSDEHSQVFVESAYHDFFRIDYSCLEGWTGALGGEGNHGLDPFLSLDWVPGPGSGVIDAGSNELATPDRLDVDGDGNHFEKTPLDLAGRRRFVDDPAAQDSGQGQAPVIDMGAFEAQGR